jgi:hypothetical protein
MNNKLSQLAARRQQLVALSAAQRATLAYDLEPWRARLALVDRGVAGIRYVRRHPVLMLGGALVFAALRLRQTGKWLQRGLLVWQIGRSFRQQSSIRKTG